MRTLVGLVLVVALSGCAAVAPKHSDSPALPATDVAAKVAAVMAANDITVPDVATFLAARGWTIMQAAIPTWRWTHPTTGTPVAYYVWRMQGAVGDSLLAVHLPAVVGPYRLEVRGVDAQRRVGPWSLVGWSDGGDGTTAIPGVAE